MRRRLFAGLLIGAACCMAQPAVPAPAEVVVSVNKATQSMSVLVDGIEAHRFVVSTGTGGGPPAGAFKPQRLERKWASRKYGMAPMPYSIFFHGNYAVHGTNKISQLGRRASKGCVRLHPRDAAVLFDLVKKHGPANTAVVVSNDSHVAARVPKDAPASEPKAVTATAAPSVRETTARAPEAPVQAGPVTTGAVPAVAPQAAPVEAAARRVRGGTRS